VTTLSRRALLAAGVGLLPAFACSRRKASPDSAPAPAITSDRAQAAPPPRARVLEWETDAPWGSDRAAIVMPVDPPPDAKFPVLFALHGRGEAVKPPAAGALGWPRDYELVRAIGRVSNPPLTRDDFEGFVDPQRLTAMNVALGAHPYEGLIVVCPHVPDMGPNDAESVRNVSKLTIETLLPRVRRELPAIATPEATGIDGVSMGGALALRVGLAHPEAFGAVGVLQAAIGEDHVQELTELARAAIVKRPSLKLRLVTSHEDYFHDAIASLSASWKAARVPHDFADLPGPHDYAFNRGPGSIELLTWYDRALRAA
jgi:enterochelin esterase-like enzyme